MSEDTRGPESPPGDSPPKDRVVQTRVPRDLESALKREARRRRLTVSHLIRNVLEDAFALVDGVVANVDDLVTDSVELVRKVGSDARRMAGAVREGGREPERAGEDDGATHVWAWNRVVLNRTANCSRCRRAMARGAEAYAGLSDEASQPREWLCGACLAQLEESGEAEGDVE